MDNKKINFFEVIEALKLALNTQVEKKANMRYDVLCGECWLMQEKILNSRIEKLTEQLDVFSGSTRGDSFTQV